MMFMKIFAFFAFAATPASSTSGASTPVSEVEDVNVANLVSSISTAYHHRALQQTTEVTDDCEAALQALESDADLVAATQAKVRTLGSMSFNDYCDVSNDSAECDIDYTTFDAAADYSDACQDAGGRIEIIGVGVICEEDGASAEIVINDNVCYPPECSNDEIGTNMDTVESVMAGQSSGSANCRVQADNERVTSGSHYNGFAATVSFAAGSVAFMML